MAAEAPLPLTVAELRQALAAGRRHFPGLRLLDVDGGDLDLSGCDLRGGSFQEARFGHARFQGANLASCGFQQALIWGGDLSSVQAPRSSWQEADLSGSRLQHADLSGARLHRCCLRGVVAAGSIWCEATLVDVDFRSGQDQLTDLGGADFRGADLSFAQLQGVQLRGADLRGSCLYGANFSGADLRQADLRGCDLRACQLDGADLQQARLDAVSGAHPALEPS